MHSWTPCSVSLICLGTLNANITSLITVVLLFSLLSCVWLCCNPMDYSPLGYSVHGISQARILEWVAISICRGSSQPRDQNCISCIKGTLFTTVVQSLSPVQLFVTPGFSILHYPPEFAQTHVHWVDDTIQPPHPLFPPSPTFYLSQHQGLFQWVTSLHQASKILAHHSSSFQWGFRVDFL